MAVASYPWPLSLGVPSILHTLPLTWVYSSSVLLRLCLPCPFSNPACNAKLPMAMEAGSHMSVKELQLLEARQEGAECRSGPPKVAEGC